MGMDQDAGLAEVLAANDRFYEVFCSGDLPAMDGLWSRREEVSVCHPNWPGVSGREDVMASWYQVMVMSEPPAIFASEPMIVRQGRAAIVFCTEEIDGRFMTASNVFVEEAGEWRLTSHYARLLPQSGEEISGDGESGDDLA